MGPNTQFTEFWTYRTRKRLEYFHHFWRLWVEKQLFNIISPKMEMSWSILTCICWKRRKLVLLWKTSKAYFLLMNYDFKTFPIPGTYYFRFKRSFKKTWSIRLILISFCSLVWCKRSGGGCSCIRGKYHDESHTPSRLCCEKDGIRSQERIQASWFDCYF